MCPNGGRRGVHRRGKSFTPWQKIECWWSWNLPKHVGTPLTAITRSTQKVKTDVEKGVNCTLPSVSTINLVPWFIYDGDRYDVDVFQGQVGPPVVPELMPNTKVDFTQPVWSGVISHHARKYLCHIPKVSLNGALTDFCFICFQLSHTHMVQKIWIYGMGSSMSVRSRENVRQAYNCSHLFHKVVTEQA